MYSRYLETVASALRTHCRQHLDGAPANVLDECVSTLAALANALAPGSTTPADATAAWLRAGPPESPGIHRDNADDHGEIARSIAAGAPILAPAARKALRDERQRGEIALRGMGDLENRPFASQDNAGAAINPGRLEAYLRAETGLASLTVADFRQVIGGRSRQTALFKIINGGSLPAELVIQRQTPGMNNSFAGTAVEVEVQRTLRDAGMKVPKILFFSTDPAPLGAAFTIMERIAGAPAQSHFWATPHSPEDSIGLAGQMAILHGHAPGHLAGVLPRPRDDNSAAGWRAEIDRLYGRLARDCHGPSVTMAAAAQWLSAHVDAIQDRETIVHNDFMLHNLMVQDGGVTGVLDWEQVALGHPAEDLGYVYPVIRDLGMWDRFLQTYRTAGGCDVTQTEIDFFALRAILRLMVMVFDGRAAFESGATDEIVIAGAGAGFAQRLHQRLSDVLDAILDRG